MPSSQKPNRRSTARVFWGVWFFANRKVKIENIRHTSICAGTSPERKEDHNKRTKIMGGGEIWRSRICSGAGSRSAGKLPSFISICFQTVDEFENYPPHAQSVSRVRRGNGRHMTGSRLFNKNFGKHLISERGRSPYTILIIYNTYRLRRLLMPTNACPSSFWSFRLARKLLCTHTTARLIMHTYRGRVTSRV